MVIKGLNQSHLELKIRVRSIEPRNYNSDQRLMLTVLYIYSLGCNCERICETFSATQNCKFINY